MTPGTESPYFYKCNNGSTIEGAHGHRGDARCLNLKAVLLHCLFLLSLHPCFVSASQLAAADQVVNTVEVALDLVENGRKLGSTKIPPGRSLSVVETSDGRVKVEASPMLSGWVDEADLKLSVAAAPKTKETTSNEAAEAATAVAADPPSARGAEPGLVKTSRIVVEETKTTEKIVAQPPSKCRGTEHHFSFLPKITRGEDLAGKDAVLRFYLVELRENEEKTKSSGATRRVRMGGESFDMPKSVYEPAVRRLKDFPLPADDEDLKPIEKTHMEGECSCCRDLRNGEILGWYAEISDGEKVVCKAQSSMDKKALAALQEHLAQAEQ